LNALISSLEYAHFVLEQAQLGFRLPLRVVELAKFDADTPDEILYGLFEAIDALNDGYHNQLSGFWKLGILNTTGKNSRLMA